MGQTQPHIILVSYYFPPENAIGGVRPSRFYKYLKKLGYRCKVVTASREAEGTDPDIITIPDSNGEIWEGKSTGPYHLHTHIERAARKVFIPGFVGLMWARDVARRCRALIEEARQDRFVIFSSFPPFGVHLAGRSLKKHRNVRWIADFRDPLRANPFVETDLFPARARWYIGRSERQMFQDADAIVANVDAAAALWRTQYPWAANKIHVIYNGFDPEDGMEARPRPDANGIVIAHAGSMYSGRNANAVVASIHRLRQNGHPLALQTKIVLVGTVGVRAGIDEALYSQASDAGWLRYVPKQIPKAEARQLTEEADVLLLLQPQTTIQVPGKLFEYIQIGRPILALTSPDSAIGFILERAGVPFTCVDPDEGPEAVDSKVAGFLELPETPTTPSEWFREHFDVRRQTAHLAEIIQSLV